MKLATTLLLAGLLLASVSAVRAADTSAASQLENAQPSQAAPALEAPASTNQVAATPATGCQDTDTIPLAAAGALPPVGDQSLSCGACSDAICVGAPIGQIPRKVAGTFRPAPSVSPASSCPTPGWRPDRRPGRSPRPP
jgi:hypothetical protein